MARKYNQSIQQSAYENLYPFITILPLLLLPPFFRGMFFDTESLVAFMYAACILAVYVLRKKEYLKLNLNYTALGFWGLTISYIIAMFVAYNLREAIGDAFRYINYLIIFSLIASLANDLPKLRMASMTMFLSGVGVALVGIGSAYGTFTYNGAYVDGLINSSLQYHNAAAIYLMASGIIGLYFAATTEQQWLKYSVSACNFLILITAFGAGSRGAMLVGPIVFLLLFVGLPQGVRGKAFLALVAIGLPFAGLSKFILNFSSGGICWLYLFIGMGLTSLIHYGLSLGFDKVEVKISRKTIWIALVAVTVILGVFVLLFSNKIMPQTISDRLHNVSMQQNSVQERFTFYKDALKIIKDHPVLGTGGGGWNAVYREYQSYLYHSTEVHNHALQVWVEAGTVGFFFYILLWGGLLVTAIKIRFFSSASGEYTAVSWAAFCAAVAIGLHSLIDFSLSLGSVAILMFSQFGIVNAVGKKVLEQPKSFFEFKPNVRKFAGLTIGVLFFIGSIALYLGDSYFNDAATSLQAGDLATGKEKLEHAVKYDPVNSNFRLQLAQVYAYEASQTNNQSLNEMSLTQAEKSMELNKASSENVWMVVQAATALKDVDVMLKYAEEGVRLAPLVQDGWDNLDLTYLNAAKIYASNNQPDKAKEIIKKIFEVPKRLEAIMATKSELEKSIWKGTLLGPDQKTKEVEDGAEQLMSTL